MPTVFFSENDANKYELPFLLFFSVLLDTEMCFVTDKAIEYDMHGNLCIPLQHPTPSYT